MAAEVQPKLETANSCCATWKNKYSKLEEKRNALRQAVKLLEQQIDKIQSDSKKACDEQRARADIEKEGKDKECAARLALENEISTLKSEIISLKQREGKSIGEAKLLQGRISEGENEINLLKEIVQKERKNAEAEKRKAAKAQKLVEDAKRKSEQERNVVKHEKERDEEYKLHMELLRKEADEAKSKLASQLVKLEEANKRVEVEKQRAIKDRKNSEAEKAKAEEQRKLAEGYRKKVVEGNCHVEKLSRQLEENRKTIEQLQMEVHELRKPGNHINTEVVASNTPESKFVFELSAKLEEANKRLRLEKQKATLEKERADAEMVKGEKQKKLAEVNWKKAKEEKSRADRLSRQVEEGKEKIEELRKEMHKLSSSQKLADPSAGSVAGSMELKLLKKQLKLEKNKKKHTKQVVELERSRNSILQQELGFLKLGFDQFSSRLNMLHKSFSPSIQGIQGPGKTGMHRLDTNNPCGSDLQRQNELLKLSCPAMYTSGTCRQTLQHPAHLCPVPGGNCIESITGINSKSESLLGGSTRTMLKSPAINSSTTSFSDGQLVAQDKGTISVTASAQFVQENAQPTLSNLSGEVTDLGFSENVAVVAENSVRSPVSDGDVGRVNEQSRKRKRMLDAVESIENLYSEDKKLHMQIEEKLTTLRGMLNKQMEGPFKEGKFLLSSLHGNPSAKRDKIHKKKKRSSREKGEMQHACDNNEREKSEKVVAEVHGNSNVPRLSYVTPIDQRGTSESNREGIIDSVTSDFETKAEFEELNDFDYMKLLKLDNAADEKCFEEALEMPLSPTLPDIGVPEADMFNAVDPIPSVNKTVCEGLSENTVLPSRRDDAIDVDVSSNKLKSNGSPTSTNSLLCNNESQEKSLDIPGNVLDNNKGGGCLIADSFMDVEMANATILGDEKAYISYPSEPGPADDNILQQCVVFSNIKDACSISKIYYVIRNVITQCPITKTCGMMREILVALKSEEKLLAKEKACILFSLMMINLSAAAQDKFGNSLNLASKSCLDLFSGHLHSVMSDGQIRRLFSELGCLDELLSLIENFLVDRCVDVLKDVSLGSTIECDSRVDILVDGANKTLSSVPSSEEQVVAGSILLASICAALDNIGFVCQSSYNILRARRFSNSLLLTILHIFAHLGGEKYFKLGNYSLTMTVVKSIVRNLEEQDLSDTDSCAPSVSDAQSLCFPCVKCPFLKDVLSVDCVTSLLLEKFNINDISRTTHGDVIEPVGQPHEANSDGTCRLNNYAVSANQSDVLCNLSDLLALVELVACHMGWEWTCDRVVPQLQLFLESCVFENLSSGIVILLGQLGRLGVEASGCEDKRVQQLRCSLSAFLGRDSTTKAGLPLQIATATALLDLVSVDFGTIIQSTEKFSSTTIKSVAADSIRKWFSSLSKKQKDLSFEVLQIGSVNNN
ncbi:hypothetical protein UlMin_019498 [Ulmus minor]